MERRKAITTAAAASLTLLAGAVGIALNSGIADSAGDDRVGQLSPVAVTGPGPVVVGDTVTGGVTPAPPVQPTTRAPITTSAASGLDETRDDDDGHEYGESEERLDDDEDDEEEHEYEGADDDD